MAKGHEKLQRCEVVENTRLNYDLDQDDLKSLCMGGREIGGRK
jgi:hypothetical protein